MSTVRLHHEVDGGADAPAVVLLGSLGSTLQMWDPQVPALSEHFRVLRVDLRGHGGSPAPDGPYSLDELVDDVVALLDELGVRRTHVVGLSLGGMVAMRLASRFPARADRLVLLCTTAGYDDPAPWAERAATVREKGTEAIADAVVARWFTPDLARRDPALVARHREMIAATTATGYAGCCSALEHLDLHDDLARIAAPTLVIAGADDSAAGPDVMATIANGIAGARLVVVAPAAHLANAEATDAVNAALLTHLRPAGSSDHDRGMRTRREVLGDAHVDRAIAATTTLTAPFQDFITRYAWGDVWSRPGLDRRTRSMLTLALLSALGHERELAMHVRAAIRNGVTADEVAEVLLHTAVYAGVPVANTALAIAREVLDEQEPDA